MKARLTVYTEAEKLLSEAADALERYADTDHCDAIDGPVQNEAAAVRDSILRYLGVPND